MDDIDRAQLAQRKPQTVLLAKGYCYNCNESLDDPERRFCDADCRDDWQLRTKL